LQHDESRPRRAAHETPAKKSSRQPTPRIIADEVVLAEHPVLRQRVCMVLPVIPEDAPYRVREGIARRRITALTGSCPCGATAAHGDTTSDICHERGCPAVTETLMKAIRRWAR
jgi:hypothetical protein